MPNVIEWLKLFSDKKFEDRSVSEVFHEMIDGYMGTCASMNEDDLNWMDENGQLDNWDSIIFLCDCGWWCDVGERIIIDETEYCNDCKPYE